MGGRLGAPATAGGRLLSMMVTSDEEEQAAGHAATNGEQAGQHVAALAAAEEGIARAESSGECFYAAELHRLRGVLAAQLDPGRREDATASIQKATEIAREQGAGLLEQRARASLQALPQ